MKKIDVCISPELIQLYNLKDRVVVIVDVLRASSTMIAALGNGIKTIRPFSSVPACMEMRRNGYFIAGERGGAIIDDFDLGNSPRSFLNEKYFGENLAMTTTNGTLAIKLSQGASEVIIGALINLDAVVNYLKSQNRDVLVFCAGWKGKVNLEDTFFAGALAKALEDEFISECDAPVAAKAIYEAGKNNIHNYLKDSSHVKRLRSLGIEDDIEFCLTPNQYDIVPVLQGDDIVLI